MPSLVGSEMCIRDSSFLDTVDNRCSSNTAQQTLTSHLYVQRVVVRSFSGNVFGGGAWPLRLKAAMSGGKGGASGTRRFWLFHTLHDFRCWHWRHTFSDGKRNSHNNSSISESCVTAAAVDRRVHGVGRKMRPSYQSPKGSFSRSCSIPRPGALASRGSTSRQRLDSVTVLQHLSLIHI